MILQAIDDSILLALDNALFISIGSSEPVTDYITIPQEVSVALSLESYNLSYTNGVYLSGEDYTLINNYLSTGYFEEFSFANDFTNVKSLSSYFPAFSGYKLAAAAYQIQNNNQMIVKLPPVSSSDVAVYYNLIIKNRGGYSKNLLYYPVSDPSPTPTVTSPPSVTPTPTLTLTPTRYGFTV